MTTKYIPVIIQVKISPIGKDGSFSCENCGGMDHDDCYCHYFGEECTERINADGTHWTSPCRTCLKLAFSKSMVEVDQ